MWPLLLAAATVAQTPEPERDRDRDPWREKPIAIATHRGAGLPMGRWNLSLEVSTNRRFAVQLGAGTNLDGLQLSVMPRVRFPVDTNLALALSSGISTGKFIFKYPELLSRHCWEFFWCARDDLRSRTWERAWWWNVDAGIEGRDFGGFDVRFYGGVAVNLQPGAGVCAVSDPSAGLGCTQRDGALVFYGGLSLGWAFGLW